MKVILTAKEIVAADTIQLRLADPGGQHLPSFLPGAHIETNFGGFERRYSLVSSPKDLRSYAVCVLHADASRGGSRYVHEKLVLGEAVDISAPINAFPLVPNATKVIFVAGGIGVTPFFTMIEALEQAGRAWELHYAVRHASRAIEQAKNKASTTLYVGEQHQRMQIENIIGNAPQGAQIYVCGPNSMIDAVRQSAKRSNRPNETVHAESFGTSMRAGDRPIKVHLARSGIEFDLMPGTTVLDAMLEHGAWAPYECRRGECGSCATRVLAGEPDHRDICLTAEQRATEFAPCISWAKSSELTLDA